MSAVAPNKVDAGQEPCGVEQETGPRRSRLLVPAVMALFAVSGGCALIYELCWYQVLQLAVGSTTVSLGILLATFMAGLGLGAIMLPRLRFTLHPLRLYAAVEAGVGLFALIGSVCLPLAGRLYVEGAEHGLPGMLLRAVAAAFVMLPTTFLMGASVPALARWTGPSRRGLARMALLYGANTAGAVVGCLGAGFYLLRLYDPATTLAVAVAINLLVAIAALGLSFGDSPAPGAAAGSRAPRGRILPTPATWAIYATTALSGAAALGAEVVWTRLISISLLGTVYVFSIILAVFLAGLSAGAAAAAWIPRRIRPAVALGWCQLLLAAAIAWSGVKIARGFAGGAWDASVAIGHWKIFAIDFYLCAEAILPAALLFGASLPLAWAAAMAGREGDPASATGRLYAANTAGGIAGALLFSLVLVPAIGTHQSERLLVALAAAGALTMFASLPRSRASGFELAGCLGLAVWLGWVIPPISGQTITYGRLSQRSQIHSETLYVAEGRNSSLAIERSAGNVIVIGVNGHVEATTQPHDMRLQRLVANLPAIIHGGPRNVLNIGFGAGVTAGSFTRYPGIETITICEIEPAIPPASAKYFAVDNYDVLDDPRTRIVYDDARHFLLTSRGKFDIIASDPLDVFIKGTASLYTLEYFEAVKRHLNPGGLFSLYVPLYETDERTIKSEIATFFQAFPYGTIWANTRQGRGYDLVFLATLQPLAIDLNAAAERLDSAGFELVRRSLEDVQIDGAADLFGTFLAQRSDLAAWIAGAEVNTDGNLRLSYLAGWGVNSQMEDRLYRTMLAQRNEPANIFGGSPGAIAVLQASLRGRFGQGAAGVATVPSAGGR